MAVVGEESTAGILTVPIPNRHVRGHHIRANQSGRRWGTDPSTTDVTYTADEVEFMLAMERLKRRLCREPTCRDVLAVARSLGYRKVL